MIRWSAMAGMDEWIKGPSGPFFVAAVDMAVLRRVSLDCCGDEGVARVGASRGSRLTR